MMYAFLVPHMRATCSDHLTLIYLIKINNKRHQIPGVTIETIILGMAYLYKNAHAICDETFHFVCCIWNEKQEENVPLIRSYNTMPNCESNQIVIRRHQLDR
jgi:hypothetical protein